MKMYGQWKISLQMKKFNERKMEKKHCKSSAFFVF